MTDNIKCIFVGDLAFGDHPKSVGFGFHSRYKQGIPPVKAETLFPPEYHHDILFGNLEFTLGDTALTANSYGELNCRGIAKYVDFLVDAGFNVLNVANNHIYQHGTREFEKTIEHLVNKGIGVAGLEDGYSGKIAQVGDLPLCFLGWCARPRQGFADLPPYKEFVEADCYDEIATAKGKFPNVVASIHWGEEFIEIPSEEEKRIARRMIDAGATVVIGHHPHVVREIEAYKGGVIAYSLGNFICDMTWSRKTRKTAFVYMELVGKRIAKWQVVKGEIGEDYFPRFSEPGAAAKRTSDADAAKLYLRSCTSSYESVARRELRHHQLLTAIHMIRNIHRYEPHVLKSMIVGAARSRLS